jgi:DNA modification methylase
MPQIEMRPPSDLIPYPGNPRRNDQAVAAVAESIKRYGFQQPIVVDGDMVVIAGHTRLKAAQRLKLKEVPVVIAADLTPEQVREYRLADNRVAEFAEWDLEQLEIELADLPDMDWAKFDELVAELAPAPDTMDEGDPDDVPAEAAGEPVSQRGEVYELGPHRLMCGDSTSAEDWQALMGGEKAEMMFTDPPYGVGYEGGHMNKVKRERLESDDSTNIYREFLPVALSCVDGPCYMWYAGTKTYDVFAALNNQDVVVSAVLIWHKTNATYAAMGAQYKNRHEPMVYFRPSNSNMRWVGAADESTLWECKRDARNDMHPTQKPVELAERAILNHDAKTVLDAFAGSGSTIIAAAKTGRICRAMEIAPRYCDVIRKRWTKFALDNGVEPGSGALQ